MKTSEVIKFGPHKVEIKYSPTGSYSPWHAAEYEKKGGLWLLGTADVAYFMRVDNNKIYKIMNSKFDLCEKLVDISQNYEFYPAEMEEEFKNILASDEVKETPPIEKE